MEGKEGPALATLKCLGRAHSGNIYPSKSLECVVWAPQSGLGLRITSFIYVMGTGTCGKRTHVS